MRAERLAQAVETGNTDRAGGYQVYSYGVYLVSGLVGYCVQLDWLDGAA